MNTVKEQILDYAERTYKTIPDAENIYPLLDMSYDLTLKKTKRAK